MLVDIQKSPFLGLERAHRCTQAPKDIISHDVPVATDSSPDQVGLWLCSQARSTITHRSSHQTTGCHISLRHKVAR